jgi:AcrR family transcriptional regulator
MRDEARAERQAEIEEATYRVVRARGYGGTSMLAVAREAKASNETLYRWYGDKRGLFRSMVENNAEATRTALKRALDRGADPLESLDTVAPILLSMLLGDRPISLNRAAAADESGELGAALAAGGRDAVLPLIEELMRRGMANGGIVAPSARTAAEWFISLLIGDQQIRRVIHAVPAPSKQLVRARSKEALHAFRKLCGG